MTCADELVDKMLPLLECPTLSHHITLMITG